jgi:hypothetical protein
VVGKLFAKLADGKLAKELPSELPRLFREHEARVIPNPESEYAQPRPFEHAVATVVTADLQLRITQSPDGFSIDIAAPGDSPAWRPLEVPNLKWAAVDDYLADHWNRLRD